MTATAAQPVQAPDPLRENPAFRLFWVGEGVSVLGNATSAILVPLLAVVDLHAGAWWMGLLTAAAWLPWLLLGLPAGAWVDRLPARTVMIAADLISAVATVSVPLVWLGGGLGLAQLLAVALVNGCCNVFFRAAYPGLVRSIVAPEHLTAANARTFGTESVMQIAGPGLGGWLAGAVGAAAGLLADAVSFLVSAICLWRIRAPRPQRPSASDDAPMTSRIREGMRVVYRDRYLRWFTVSGGISNFGLTGYQAILVLFLVRSVHLAPGRVGLLLALGSAGGLAGAAAAGRLATRLGSARATIAAQLVGGPSVLLLVLAGPGLRSAVVPVALFLVGLGVVAGNVIKGAFRMAYVRADLLARAVTASQVVNFGTMPLAALAAGGLGSTIGLRATVACMAAIHAAASLAIVRGPIRGMRDLPTCADFAR